MKHLFTTFKVKGLALQNRIVRPPMAMRWADGNGHVTEKLLDHYAAIQGVGLVIVESCYVNRLGRLTDMHLGIYDDSCLPGLSRLAAVVRQSGAKCGIQISHNGSACEADVIGAQPIAPSPLKHPKEGSTPREITRGEINSLVKEFALAARRAVQAGFDFVEIHGAHGYLLNQFLSPYTNRRQDEYGGSLPNRMRFPLQVLAAVREEVGPDYPVFYRLAADDDLPGGITPDEALEAAILLEKAGIDVLDLSRGLMGARTKSGEAHNLYIAEKIKPRVLIPVILTGGITSPETAENILAAGKADLIGVGRALLANPSWAIDAAKTLE